MASRFVICFLFVLGVLSGSFAIGATVPAGFRTETFAEGINAGTALTSTPDGRVFYAEQTGHVRVLENGVVRAQPVLDLSARVNTYWERGLVGIQFDPEYPEKPFLYVVYVTNDPYVHHVVSRFTIVDGAADMASELILLEGDDQATLGGGQSGSHQGGPIRFGLDGMLYIGLGEQSEDEASQSLDTLQGKILRIAPDGSIPVDNPFYSKLEGKYRSIYALGIRNPFGLAVQPVTGRIFEADIGKSSFDEINEIQAGRNYGWPLAEGFSDQPGLVNPIHAYPPAIGRSICGSVFYPSGGAFPQRWEGKLFFADWASNWVKAIDVDDPDTALDFGEDFSRPVAIEVTPDGALWVLNRGTRWRDNNKFENNSGSLTRISYVGGDYTENEAVVFPQSLAEAGVLRSGGAFRLAKGFTRFKSKQSVWRPGTRSKSWLKMPKDGKINIVQDGHWVFPEGAMVVEHFEDARGTPHETHLYQSNGDGTYRASAYRWSAETGDARLVERSEFQPLRSDAATMWLSPGPVARLDPTTAIFGFQPQFNTRRLNVGGQLSNWSRKGWFSQKVTRRAARQLPQMPALDEVDAPALERIRAYLDTNCASCHQPGGASRGFFDARYLTPFEEQGLISDALMAGDLGVPGAKLVTPGSPETSVLYLRLARKDGFRMPPGTMSAEDPPILPLLEQWIRSLD